MRLFDPRDLHVGGSGSSDTDAVRPTGETGGSVMWKCDKCGHETPTGVEHFCATRPLPDFPAGKSEDEGWISNAISKIPKRYILCPTCGEKNRIIVCVNLCGLPTAPARPAAAKGGAYQPTSDHLDRMNPPQGSETGARCPCCQEAVDTITRLNDGKREYHTAWRCRCFVGWHDSPESALSSLVATRPLPDFPAGAPGPSLSEIMTWWGPSSDIPPQRTLELVRKVNEWWVVHAPARPAAAGLTDNEIRDCIYVGARAAGWQAEPVPSEVEFATAAIRHAVILSSRATGAEVEIPELTNDEIVALCKEAWGVSMPVSIHDISTSTVRLVRLACARRHATIRTGGGQ